MEKKFVKVNKVFVIGTAASFKGNDSYGYASYKVVAKDAEDAIAWVSKKLSKKLGEYVVSVECLTWLDTDA